MSDIKQMETYVNKLIDEACECKCVEEQAGFSIHTGDAKTILDLVRCTQKNVENAQ